MYAVGIQKVVWPLVVTSEPEKALNTRFKLPRHTAEPARGVRGFITASWESLRKYPNTEIFLFLTRPPTSTLKLKLLTNKEINITAK